jgi:cell division transport system permease protein
MRILKYSSDAALKNLWREKWINLLSSLSIGTVLLILGAFLITAYNIESFINTWFNDFSIAVYMDDAVSSNDKKALRKFLSQDSDISELRYVSKDKALAELQSLLGTESTLLDSVKGNPLPSSFELKLKREVMTPALLEQKAALIRQFPGVDDVQYGEKWLISLFRLTTIIRLLVLVIGAALLAAVTFISYSTIKILFFRRMEEIETMKLLGATRRFIRLPFLIEGIIIGTLGGALCSASLFLAHQIIVLRLTEFLPAVRADLFALPPKTFLAGPAAGALLSIIGSHLAVGKIRYL